MLSSQATACWQQRSIMPHHDDEMIMWSHGLCHVSRQPSYLQTVQATAWRGVCHLRRELAAMNRARHDSGGRLLLRLTRPGAWPRRPSLAPRTSWGSARAGAAHRPLRFSLNLRQISLDFGQNFAPACGSRGRRRRASPASRSVVSPKHGWPILLVSNPG